MGATSERRRQRSGVQGGSGRPEPGSIPPFARPRGRPQFVLGPLEFHVLEAGPAVTRTVTGPVTPQTTRRYAAFPRKSRLVRFFGPLAFSGAARGNARGNTGRKPNAAGVSARELIAVSAIPARTMTRTLPRTMASHVKDGHFGGDNGLFGIWRRKTDSNLRASCPANGLQDRRLRPLGHSSVSIYSTCQPPAIATARGASPSRYGSISTGVPLGARRQISSISSLVTAMQPSVQSVSRWAAPM